jgi:hypothetical protein
MKFFDAIGHFFKSLFGADSTVVQTVLHEVSSVATLAQPIIADVEANLKAPAAAGSSIETKLLAFLGKYDGDVAKVATTATALAALPVADMLAKAAQFALATFVPAGTAASLINYAVEFAYQVFKTKTAPVVIAK